MDIGRPRNFIKFTTKSVSVPGFLNPVPRIFPLSTIARKTLQLYDMYCTFYLLHEEIYLTD
jgi:hypothetical protein